MENNLYCYSHTCNLKMCIQKNKRKCSKSYILVNLGCFFFFSVITIELVFSLTILPQKSDWSFSNYIYIIHVLRTVHKIGFELTG